MKLSDAQAAANELEYWKAKIQSIEAAIKRLDQDLRICKKEQTVWQGRLERAEKLQRAKQAGGAEGGR